MAKLKVLFVYPNLFMMNLVPPAIGLLSALLRGEGYEVDVFDTTYYQSEGAFDSDKKKEENLQVRPFNLEEKGIHGKNTDMYADFRERVRSFQPDLLAMSAVEDVWGLGSRLLAQVRQYNVPVIVGGVFATFAPNVVIQDPSVDIVCVGEGEVPLLELCRKLTTGEDYSRIANLWVKRPDGTVVKSAMQTRVDISTLPMPDYSLFEDKRFYRPMAGRVYRMLPIETHRGCPYSCQFCNSPSQQTLYRFNKAGSYFRKKNIAKVHAEMTGLIKAWNLEYVYFTADTFLAWSEREFDEFIEMYADFKLPFWIQTRVETIEDEKMKKLKEVGIHRMSIGLEHGNEKYRKEVLKRNVTNEEIIRAFKIAEHHDIPVTVNNITGFPDETRALAQSTIEINAQIKTDTTNCYAFTPFHGTPLRELSIRRGYMKEDAITQCLTGEPVLEMPNFPKEQIKGLMRTMPMYAKFPRDVWPRIARAERFDAEGNAVFEGLRKEYVARFFTGESVS